MQRIIKAPPPDLAGLLIDLGSRSLVVLEGQDDLYAFSEWFLEHEDKLMFYVHGEGGSKSVLNFLPLALSAGTTKRVYGVIDRDFRDEADVQTSLDDVNTHLLISRRYTLENYLLEPSVVQEELRVCCGTKFVPLTTTELQNGLLQLCKQLCTVMAANWVLLEGSGKFLSEGFDTTVRSNIVQQVAVRLTIDTVEAEQRIVAKEVFLNSKLATLETAHQYVSGKFLMHKVHGQYFKFVEQGMSKDYLFRRLVQTVKQQGVHVDIRAIVEGKILV